MSTSIAGASTRLHTTALFVAGMLVFTVAGISQAAPDATDSVRSSISRHIAKGGRDNPTFSSESVDEYDALATSGARGKPTARGGLSKLGSGSQSTQSASLDFWFYDADVQLFNDDDRDGYFYGIDLLFDADTIYSAAEVYAVVYLSLDFGPWNEYGVTEDFWIYGASGTDEYVLVTELMSGYPTGNYDLLIELFDAADSSFLASFGPDDTSALSFLPLEDFNRDAPIDEIPVAVSHGHGGGGAADTWTISILLLLLVVSAARKIWRRRNDELIRIDSPAPCWDVRTNAPRQSLQ
ncbi:MAG: choice-of-anchor H family protein, partial [Proteobacteria bacterium]|nr:choice-of-anchor H family protein [Pseudomonadota bacterium]